MRPKGKRIAFAAAVGDLAILAVVLFLTRGAIFEQWNSYRLKNGDEKAQERAIEWMAEQGGESSLIALGKRCASR